MNRKKNDTGKITSHQMYENTKNKNEIYVLVTCRLPAFVHGKKKSDRILLAVKYERT